MPIRIYHVDPRQGDDADDGLWGELGLERWAVEILKTINVKCGYLMTTALWMFDFDGVIADSLDVFHESLAAACRDQGGGCDGCRVRMGTA